MSIPDHSAIDENHCATCKIYCLEQRVKELEAAAKARAVSALTKDPQAPASLCRQGSTTVDFEDLKRKARAATPGPWQSSVYCGAQVCAGTIIEERPGHIAVASPGFFLLEIDPFVYERPSDYENGDGDEEGDADDYEEDSEQRAFADAAFIAAANPSTILELIRQLEATHAHIRGLESEARS